jgi:hypothetical protein
MPKPTTINEVLNELDAIIYECISTNSRLGYFAYVYRRTTAEIASEIAKGSFQNNRRLEEFDVVFANLYIDAYKDFKANKAVSKVWEFSFQQDKAFLTIIQHILMGMNAHINLDLSIAAARVMKGKDIKDLKSDFDKVNDILFQLTNELQARLSRVSPLMVLSDWVGQNTDEKVIDFSMRKAREQSWNSANLFWSLGDSHNKKAIQELDNLTLKLSQRIKNPRLRTLQFILKIMRFLETNQVSKVLLKLKAN